ncbi:MAG: DUF2125 domain-containing protein [Caulobacterales bacterium]
MTLPDRAPPRKPSRLGLYGPFVLLLIVLAAWSAYWIWARGKLEQRVDRGAASLRAAGFEVAWTSRRIYGFPFRLDLDFANLRLREASGWALAAPLLKCEAWAYTPGHWIAVASQGVTFTRPSGGGVSVGGQALRASLSALGESPPRLSVEGLNLTFTPAPGARPFFAQTARELHLHTRAGPDDQGAVYFSLEGVAADPSGVIGRIADGKPVSIEADAIFSHASALSGHDWPGMVRAWSRAGGALRVRQATIQAGEALLDARTGDISVGEDGRLHGRLTASLRDAPRAVSILGGGPAAELVAGAVTAAPLTIQFENGRTELGVVPVAGAPKVFP